MCKHSPIIILASSPRSGSTLIQRLLCSSENAIIYGDLIGQEVEFFISYISARTQMYQYQSSLIEPLRTGVISGRKDQFIASMTPKISELSKALRQSATQWLDACQADAEDAGCSLWGWKHAGANPMVIQALPEWFPNARFITLDRPLIDSVRSAKAAQMIDSSQDIQQFCQQWQQTKNALNHLSQVNSDSVLALEYEEVLSNQAYTIQLIEAHTGAVDIDPQVLESRLNSIESPEAIPPAKLSEEEVSIVRSFQPAQTSLPV